MKTSVHLDELSLALSKAQGEIGNPEKSRQGHHYSYADLAQVLEIGRPVLSKHGLSVVQLPSYDCESGHVTVTTRLLHSSGQWIEGDMSIALERPKNLSVEQAAGKTVTYLRRISYAAAVGVYQQDTDGSNNGVEAVPVVESAVDSKEAEMLRKAATSDELASLWQGFSNEQRKELSPVFGQEKKRVAANG